MYLDTPIFSVYLQNKDKYHAQMLMTVTNSQLKTKVLNIFAKHHSGANFIASPTTRSESKTERIELSVKIDKTRLKLFYMRRGLD